MREVESLAVVNNGYDSPPPPNKGQLIRVVSEERFEILDLIDAAKQRISEDNPAHLVLTVLSGLIDARHKGDGERFTS